MMYRDVMDKTIEFINLYFPPMSEAEKTNLLGYNCSALSALLQLCTGG
jgi:hypothetical protein